MKEVALQLPQFETNPGCTDCPAHAETVANVCVPTIHMPESLPPSPETPAIVMVGQNPGLQEDQKNEPFVGPSGVFVRGNGKVRGVYTHAYGLWEKASIYLTNAVRCHTLDNAAPKWGKHIKPCAHYTLADLQKIVPTCSHLHVVALGAVANVWVCRSLLGEKKTPSQRECFGRNGETRRVDDVEITCWYTYHPAYCLRNPNVVSAVDAHLRLLAATLDGEPPMPSDPEIVDPFPP